MTPPPPDQGDILTLVVVLISMIAGAQVAQILAPFVVIFAAALTGSAVALMRRPPSTRWWAFCFVGVMTVVSLLLTGVIAHFLNLAAEKWLGLDIGHNWFLVPVAGGIAAIGTEWRDVATWLGARGNSWITRKTGGAP